MQESLWMWGIFFTVIVSILCADLGLFNKSAHEMSVKESLYMSAIYIAIAFLFGLWIAYTMGGSSFAEYATGYLVEKSLSLDNIFVISLIFSKLSIPKKHQHRVLFFGILGAIILRGIMIAIGAELITNIRWVLYFFSAFMIFTGIKMLITKHKLININDNPLLKLLRKYFRVTNNLEGEAFFVYESKVNSAQSQLFITPLFVALALVEFTDLVFAVDSVPAIFTITKDPYIVYTSNIFAILGLRALYLALAATINQFYYLKFSLASILIFIGSKVFIIKLLGIEHFPAFLSLSITFGLLALGFIYSIWKARQQNGVRKDS